MIAIVSDLHSNIEALSAVLADIEEHKAEAIVCLGDVVGYGPNPIECIEIARKRFKFTLLGNHEEAVLFGAVGFNPKAKMAIDWTRDQFRLPGEDPEVQNARWQFMGDMPLSVEGDAGIDFVHGSPRDPTREYVFPTDVLNPAKVREIMSEIKRCCFNGHTHTPGILTESGVFKLPHECGYGYELGEEKVLINVGSVGQPRDGDNRSSYVLLDGNNVLFRRVPYDFRKTMEAMAGIDRLPAYLAQRLEEGR